MSRPCGYVIVSQPISVYVNKRVTVTATLNYDFAFIAKSFCFTLRGAQRLSYRVEKFFVPFFFLRPCDHISSQTARARKLKFCTINDPSRGTNIFENKCNRLNIMETSGKKSIILSVFAIYKVTLRQNLTKFDTFVCCYMCLHRP